LKINSKALVVLALGTLIATGAMGFTGVYNPGSGINGTPHDLGTAQNGMNYVAQNPADPLTRICIFCHAPHNAYRLASGNGGFPGGGPQAPIDFDYLPLWNHTLTGNAGLYHTYWNGPGAPQTGPKASQAIANGMNIGSTSLLCLSCHDGSIAINSYGNSSQPATAQSSGGGPIGLGYQIGLDNNLQNHHPIGFDYDAVSSATGGPDTEIRSADVAQLGGAGTVRAHLYGPGGNTHMECTTCHSTHNTGNTGESLLWRSDKNSRLCLTCHIKGTDPGVTIP